MAKNREEVGHSGRADKQDISMFSQDKTNKKHVFFALQNHLTQKLTFLSLEMLNVIVGLICDVTVIK